MKWIDRMKKKISYDFDRDITIINYDEEIETITTGSQYLELYKSFKGGSWVGLGFCAFFTKMSPMDTIVIYKLDVELDTLFERDFTGQAADYDKPIN